MAFLEVPTKEVFMGMTISLHRLDTAGLPPSCISCCCHEKQTTFTTNQHPIPMPIFTRFLARQITIKKALLDRQMVKIIDRVRFQEEGTKIQAKPLRQLGCRSLRPDLTKHCISLSNYLWRDVNCNCRQPTNIRIPASLHNDDDKGIFQVVDSSHACLEWICSTFSK